VAGRKAAADAQASAVPKVTEQLAGWGGRSQVFFSTKFDIFILFLTSFSAAHVEKWPWRPKIRHGFDMAGNKFDMPSGSGTLFASTLLLANLQPAQTGSAMSSCCQKRRAEARNLHSARQKLGNGSKLRHGFGKIRHVLDKKIKKKLWTQCSKSWRPQQSQTRAGAGPASMSILMLKILPAS
jgi:hypothetical protein